MSSPMMTRMFGLGCCAEAGAAAIVIAAIVASRTDHPVILMDFPSRASNAWIGRGSRYRPQTPRSEACNEFSRPFGAGAIVLRGSCAGDGPAAASDDAERFDLTASHRAFARPAIKLRPFPEGGGCRPRP